MNASYSGRPMSEIAFSSRLLRVVGVDLAGLLGDQRAGLAGVWLRPKNWLIRARFIGIG